MKKYLIFPAIILCLMCTQPTFADLYQDGISAYRNGNYKLAEYYFREAVKIFPDNINYRYYLAITLVQRGAIEEAEVHYQKVIDLAPESEAASKAKRGIMLIASAKVTNDKDDTPTAMINVASSSPHKTTIHMTRSNNAIIIPNVILNNKLGVNFILDTGATYTSISKSTANQLGLDLSNARIVSLKTANGIIQVPRIVLDTININGIEAYNVEVTIHDVPAAKNVTGLLGLSFLDQFKLTIEKKNNKIILEKI
jgi:clan AA aspartic protease (TIGR02281 family)